MRILSKIINNYKCAWCNFEFTQKVLKNNGKGKKGCTSDQVKCPNCHNFIKTWE
jgi:DNA-directed RNA polymerase subunit RPC12/RpoP